MFGSGQWTIFEGYAATKLMRARLPLQQPRSERPPLHGLGRGHASSAPSAWTSRWAATTTSRTPTPSCSGARTWPRCTRSSGPGSPTAGSAHPHVRIHTLSTYEHRTTDLSDAALIFKPGTDLAILNYIANHIIQTSAVNRDFVDKHVNFRMANTDIGYGLRPEHVLEQRAPHANDAAGLAAADLRRLRQDGDANTRSTRRPSSAASPRSGSEALAKAYADPKTKVMSLWTMGFNQHVRGVWANHLVYNIHLLTGKIAEPGNSPFSLTGQPSACGTAREVGTFAASPARRHAGHQSRAPQARGAHLEAPGGPAARQGRLPRRAAGPDAEGRQAQRLLDHVQQQPPDGAEHQQRDLSGLPQPRELHRLSRTPIRPSRRWRPTSSCRPRCGSRRRAPTATPSGAPTCGTSSSTRRARPAPTCGS